MQPQTINVLIDQLIEREGGYVDHPADRGGPTNFGVTIRTLSDYRHSLTLCTAKDVEKLTLAEARRIYKKMYWEEPRFNDLRLSPVLTEMVFDAGVHHGPTQAAKMLQDAIGVEADGIIGAKTLAMAARLDAPHLAAWFMAERNLFLGRLLTRDPSQAVFAHGWDKRISEFIKQIPYA
jgi:lysozyme family protein